MVLKLGARKQAGKPVPKNLIVIDDALDLRKKEGAYIEVGCETEEDVKRFDQIGQIQPPKVLEGQYSYPNNAPLTLINGPYRPDLPRYYARGDFFLKQAMEYYLRKQRLLADGEEITVYLAGDYVDGMKLIEQFGDDAAVITDLHFPEDASDPTKRGVGHEIAGKILYGGNTTSGAPQGGVNVMDC